jgi:hypothetical protein
MELGPGLGQLSGVHVALLYCMALVWCCCLVLLGLPFWDAGTMEQQAYPYLLYLQGILWLVEGSRWRSALPEAHLKDKFRGGPTL